MPWRAVEALFNTWLESLADTMYSRPEAGQREAELFCEPAMVADFCGFLKTIVLDR